MLQAVLLSPDGRIGVTKSDQRVNRGADHGTRDAGAELPVDAGARGFGELVPGALRWHDIPMPASLARRHHADSVRNVATFEEVFLDTEALRFDMHHPLQRFEVKVCVRSCVSARCLPQKDRFVCEVGMLQD